MKAIHQWEDSSLNLVYYSFFLVRRNPLEKEKDSNRHIDSFFAYIIFDELYASKGACTAFKEKMES